LLIGIHYFGPDIMVDIINNCLNILENILETLNYRVFLGDFNVSGFDWNCILPSPNCHFYTKLKRESIHSATCFLGLSQHNYRDKGNTLLDLLFSNFAELSVNHVE
jgi:hypothetical protein